MGLRQLSGDLTGLVFACFLVGAGWGADLERFTISQVIPQLPVVTSYVDVVDSNGQPLTNLVPISFSATLGVTPLQVAEVRPFESTGEGVAYAFLAQNERPPGSAGEAVEV